ncbi:LuxR C-terminal-related transcriptional regulator [Streptomyces sp. V4-01]|uniref:LuxR C-terminal-related transcriptional regulator n=1 Tax=Actinacidiphila polyblastidii TaxID=3110430 RepID=A0ABU7PFC2_9ACTN|nr:LuxR C-terminal-related transcriptional regulator [Streptomyces sp. V4-01]
MRRLSSGEIAVFVLLADGLRTAGIGQRLHISPSTVRAVLDRIRHKVGGTGQHGMVDRVYRGGHLPAPAVRPPLPGTELDPAQRHILLLMAAGATAGEIAFELRVSPHVAETRVRDLRGVLRAFTTAHALHLGWQRGYLHPGQAPPDRPGQARTTNTGTNPDGEAATTPAAAAPTAYARAARVPATVGLYPLNPP